MISSIRSTKTPDREFNLLIFQRIAVKMLAVSLSPMGMLKFTNGLIRAQPFLWAKHNFSRTSLLQTTQTWRGSKSIAPWCLPREQAVQ